MHTHRRFILILALLVCLTGAASAQSGYTWQIPANSPSTGSVKFDDIYFIDSLTGMACNGDGVAYRTTDGGVTWVNVLQNSQSYFRSVVMTDALHAWVGNFGNFPGSTNPDTVPLYQTSDGGSTWSPAPIPTNTDIGICGLFRVGSQHLYGVGRVQGPSTFVRSTDAGVTWSYTDMAPFADFLVDLHFSGVDTGIVIGGTDNSLQTSHPLILRTVDGGMSWDTVYIGGGAPETWCWKVDFPSPNIGYASIEGASAPVQCLKTTDAGLTWNVQTISNSQFNLQGIGFVNELVGWAGGYYGSHLHETTDGGVNWTPSSTIPVNLNRIRRLSPTLLWASGIRLYKITPTPATSTAPPEHEQLDWQLRRCNSGQCVMIDIPNPDPLLQYELRMYDVVGREMRTQPLTTPASTMISLEGVPNTFIYFVVTEGQRQSCRLYAR
ncbi:MAG: hypothetical protein U0176_18325 [Bacteroidia bacterium]